MINGFCITCRRMKNSYRVLIGIPVRRYHMEDRGLRRRTVLKWWACGCGNYLRRQVDRFVGWLVGCGID